MEFGGCFVRVYTFSQNSPPSFSQYLLPGHPQGLSIKVAGYDFCCGVAGAGGMSILVDGAGWEVMLRAGSVKLEASGLLESQNGHCGAGACVEGHERVPRHIVGLGEQATACGQGPRSLGRRQGRAMAENQACAWKDPDW